MSNENPADYYREYENGDAYFADEDRHSHIAARLEVEASLADEVVLRGGCDLCQTDVDFQVFQPEDQPPNWRETLACPSCGLSNRVRNALQLLHRFDSPASSAKLYLTEERSSAYKWLKSRFPKTVGSEYLGEQSRGGKLAVRFREWMGMRGGRSEDLTHLSFRRRSIDQILCFDVLEHVPDYRAALAECARVLKPGGALYVTVPFLRESPETLVRARLDSTGEVEHLLEPEYHGDPLQDAGCLCFYHFGWDFLDDMHKAGFSDVRAIISWSRTAGHLGGLEVFRAVR